MTVLPMVMMFFLPKMMETVEEEQKRQAAEAAETDKKEKKAEKKEKDKEREAAEKLAESLDIYDKLYVGCILISSASASVTSCNSSSFRLISFFSSFRLRAQRATLTSGVERKKKK
jgi:hypothetical protein